MALCALLPGVLILGYAVIKGQLGDLFSQDELRRERVTQSPVFRALGIVSLCLFALYLLFFGVFVAYST